MGDGAASELVLGPILRHVTATTATVWVETSGSAEVAVLGATARTFSVKGKHYGLVVVEDLEPGTTTEYDVRLDGRRVWPQAGSTLPASVIRTPGDGGVDLLVGSCRAAAPHEPPYTLELALDDRGRGVDTLWAHAARVVGEGPENWPTLLLLVGDQIYADDSSPRTKDRIEACRPPECDLPASIVLDFDEYCWLYHEAWTPFLERWLFSVVPSLMIWDDHDMIDDWNISASWVAEMRAEPWWEQHEIGGVMSYWIYQHLGNLSPAEIRAEGLLDRLTAVDDGTEILEAWARQVAARPGENRFSYAREVGDVKVVVVDGRQGRVLDGDRQMVDEAEWAWVREQALDHSGHLVLATTLPVFIAPGLHDLQVWNERVCAGAWGPWLTGWAERLRRSLDLEDWSAFSASYAAFVDLIGELQASDDAPRTIVVVSGDIHFSYAASIRIGDPGARVHQVVSSPIRNALIPPERGVMRFALTRAGTRIGAVLRRLTWRRPTAVRMEMTAGPFFANNMCEIQYRGDDAVLVVEHATPDEEDPFRGCLDEVARVRL